MTTGSVTVTTTAAVITTGASKPMKAGLATNEHPFEGVLGFLASASQNARPMGRKRPGWPPRNG